MIGEYRRGINSRSRSAKYWVGLAATLSTVEDGVWESHHDTVPTVKAPKLPDRISGNVSDLGGRRLKFVREAYGVAGGSDTKLMCTKHPARRLGLDWWIAEHVVGDAHLLMEGEAVGQVEEESEDGSEPQTDEGPHDLKNSFDKAVRNLGDVGERRSQVGRAVTRQAGAKVQETAGQDSRLPAGLRQTLSILISGVETVGRMGFGILPILLSKRAAYLSGLWEIAR